MTRFKMCVEKAVRPVRAGDNDFASAMRRVEREIY